jgi:threonine dehydrogenase-like Zn-dependent dehydrogenase
MTRAHMAAIGSKAFSIFSEIGRDATLRRPRTVACSNVDVMSEKKGEGVYNVVVIGAGTAGLVTAAGTAGLGGRVALIERN